MAKEYIPDYTKYKLDELYEAYQSIDRDRYPERARTIAKEIRKRKALGEDEQLKQQRKEIWFQKSRAVGHYEVWTGAIGVLFGLLNLQNPASLISVFVFGLSIWAGLELLKNTKAGITLSRIVQLFQAFKITLPAFAYYSGSLFYIMVSMDSQLSIGLTFGFGVGDSFLQFTNPEGSYYLGINLISMSILFVLFPQKTA